MTINDMVIMVNASLVATSAAASKQQQCRGLVIVTLDVEVVYSAKVSAALRFCSRDHELCHFCYHCSGTSSHTL